MTRDEIKTLMMALKTVYQERFNITPELVDIWHGVLGQKNYSEGQAAVRVFLSENNPFPPMPGQINSLIEDVRRHELAGPSAVDVWDDAQRLAQMSATQSDINQHFASNQRALKAIRAVGWDRIRYGNIETELPFIRRDFINYYNELLEYEEDSRRVLEITGQVQSILGNTLSRLPEVQK